MSIEWPSIDLEKENALIRPIKAALLAQDRTLAEEQLFLALFCSEGIKEWASCKVDVQARIPNILGFCRSIAFTFSTDTAMIDIKKGDIFLNPIFFLNYIQSYADLLELLFHERNHHLLFQLFGTPLPSFLDEDARNLAEDIYINASLRYLIQSDSYLSDRYYGFHPDKPSILLTSKWRDWVGVESASYDKKVYTLHNTLTMLEDGRFPSYEAYLNLYIQLFGQNSKLDVQPIVSRKLSKVHKSTEQRNDLDSDNRESEVNPDNDLEWEETENLPVENLPSREAERSKEAVYQKSTEGVPVYGVKPPFLRDAEFMTQLANCVGELEDIASRVEQALKFTSQMENLIDSIVGLIISSQNTIQSYEGQTTTPHYGRKEMFLLANGLIPTSFTTTVAVAKEPLVLYVDVSSSMSDYYMLINPLVNQLKSHISKIFQFSTVLVEVKDDEQLLFTTGGTSYDQVATHIVENGHKNIIVLTDNSEFLDQGLAHELKSVIEEFYLISTESPLVIRAFQEICTKEIFLNP